MNMVNYEIKQTVRTDRNRRIDLVVEFVPAREDHDRVNGHAEVPRGRNAVSTADCETSAGIKSRKTSIRWLRLQGGIPVEIDISSELKAIPDPMLTR